MRTLPLAVFAAAALLGCASPRPAERSEDAAVAVDPSAAPVLKGAVTDDRGKPVSGVRIALYGGLATRREIGSTETDANGEYQFDPVPGGALVLDEARRRWDFYVGLSLFHPKWASADGASWWDLRIPVLTRHVARRDFRVTAGGTLSGAVTDAAGRPRAGLDLRIYSDRSRTHRYASTGPDGCFEADGLFPTRYTIDVNSSPTRYPAIGQVTIEAGKTTRANLKMNAAAVPDGR